ncbi:MAG TPA: hypothetical protein V6D10_07130 [Trichocoleus sp.]|jgi:hypothetical protein
MALRKPLVMINGLPQQISSTDTLDATLAEVDQVSMTNGESSSIVIGAPVYVSAANTVKKAQANALGTMDILGIVKDVSVAAAGSASIQTDGQITATTTQWDAVTGGTGGLTAGAVYYLSATTAGQMTVTAPTTSGQYVIRIGKALSTTIFDLSIGQPIGL